MYAIRSYYGFNQCPKQQGPGFKPEPLSLKLGSDSYRLRFDCKRCEMQVDNFV